jgi:hypothetical protein
LDAVQWLDGSFLEDIESQEGRPPRDLDVVTIYWGYSKPFQENLAKSFPEFQDPQFSKKNSLLDHYPFDASHSPWLTVKMSRYWIQLFSHTRKGVWKGMLALDLNTPTADESALTYLQQLTVA